MSLLGAAQHRDRRVERACSLCSYVARADCYPRTYENQMEARRQTAQDLHGHLAGHTKAEMLHFLRRRHQV